MKGKTLQGFLIGITCVCMAFTVVNAQEKITWKWATGSVGGSWYTEGGLISERLGKMVPGFTINVVPGSSIGNVTLLNRKQADLGMSYTIWGKVSLEGNFPFKEKHPHVRAVAKLDPNFLFFLVRPDVPITSIEQIKQKEYPLSLCIRKKGDTSRFLGEHIFQEYGFSLEDIKAWGGTLHIVSKHGEAVNLVRDRHAEGWVYLSTFGHPPTKELLAGREMNFLSISDEVLKGLKEKYGFATFVVPANTFQRMTHDVKTVSGNIVIITHSEIPEDNIYTFTKVLMESKPALAASYSAFKHWDVENSGEDVGFTLHPGALRYYRERGWMK